MSEKERTHASIRGLFRETEMVTRITNRAKSVDMSTSNW